MTKTALKQNEAVMGTAVVLTQRPTQPSPGGGKQIFTINQSVFISKVAAKITWAHMQIAYAHRGVRPCFTRRAYAASCAIAAKIKRGRRHCYP